MSRRVEVVVDMNNRGYITAAVKTKEVTEDVRDEMAALGHEVDAAGRDLAGAGAKAEAAKEEFHALGDQVTEAGRHMEKLGAEAEVAEKGVGGLGNKAQGTGRDLAALDRRIDSTRRKLTQLAVEFALTGDAASGKKYNEQRSLLSRLEGLKTTLTSAGNADGKPLIDRLVGIGTQAGAQAGQAFGATFTSAAGSAVNAEVGNPETGPLLITALAAAATAAAAPISAVVAGALTGAVGLGGIAGGIFAASHDPAVQAAAHDFGSSLSAQFFASGQSFVAPIEESLQLLKADFAKVDFGSTFSRAAPSLLVLAKGVGAFVDNVMPGFRAALTNAQPVLKQLATGIGQTGTALGTFFDEVSAGKGPAEGMQVTFIALDDTIDVLGKSIHALSDVFVDFNRLSSVGFRELAETQRLLGNKQLAATFDDMAGRLGRVGDTGTQAVGAFLQFPAALSPAQKAAAELTAEMDRLNTATATVFGEFMSLDQANIAVAQAFADLQAQLGKGKVAWDNNTQAGRDHQRLLLDTIKTLQDQREAALAAANGDTQAIAIANAAYESQLKHVLAIAAAAGDSKAALDKLAGEYDVDVVLKIQNKLAADIGKLFFHGRAAGGPVTAGVPYRINEKGSETVTFPANGVVHPASMTPVPWRGGGGYAAVSMPDVNLTVKLVDGITGQVQRSIAIDHALARGVPQATIAAAYP